MLLAELPSLRAKLFLGFLCLTPLIVGVYLTFFNRHAMRSLHIWEIITPGKFEWWDRFNRITYIVTGFIFLYIGIRLFPILLSLFGGEK